MRRTALLALLVATLAAGPALGWWGPEFQAWRTDLKGAASMLAGGVRKGDRGQIGTAKAMATSIRRTAALWLLERPGDTLAKECHAASDYLWQAAAAAEESDQGRFSRMIELFSSYDRGCVEAAGPPPGK